MVGLTHLPWQEGHGTDNEFTLKLNRTAHEATRHMDYQQGRLRNEPNKSPVSVGG
jgi:hypothetical protein